MPIHRDEQAEPGVLHDGCMQRVTDSELQVRIEEVASPQQILPGHGQHLAGNRRSGADCTGGIFDADSTGSHMKDFLQDLTAGDACDDSVTNRLK